MASNLRDGFAICPMVEEGEATGVVAGVYAELLTRMPFVPSLFTSFALCPQYLVLPYEQAAGVLDGDELERTGEEIGASVRDVVRPPEQEEVRETLATFVGPLGRMLLPAGCCWHSTTSSTPPRRPGMRCRPARRSRTSPLPRKGMLRPPRSTGPSAPPWTHR